MCSSLGCSVTLWLVLRDTAIALAQYASLGAVSCFTFRLTMRLLAYCVARREKK